MLTGPHTVLGNDWVLGAVRHQQIWRLPQFPSLTYTHRLTAPQKLLWSPGANDGGGGIRALVTASKDPAIK